MCELYSEEDKKIWDMLTKDPILAAKYLAHLQAKYDHKDMVVDGSCDNKISEAEYRCDGDS